MFDELHYWLIIGSKLEDTLKIINDFSFGLSTDFLVAIFQNKKFELYDIYNTGKSLGGNRKVNFVGNWEESTGLIIEKDLNKMLRWNLEGMTLKTRGTVCFYLLLLLIFNHCKIYLKLLCHENKPIYIYR